MARAIDNLLPWKTPLYNTPQDILKLRELTTSSVQDMDTKIYPAGDNMDCVVKSLMKRDSVGVVDSWMPSGGVFPRHDHDSHEWLIPYEGTIIVELLVVIGGKEHTDEKYIVGPKEKNKSLLIPPGIGHRVTALDDIRLIGVTIPSDEGYPGVVSG